MIDTTHAAIGWPNVTHGSCGGPCHRRLGLGPIGGLALVVALAAAAVGCDANRYVDAQRLDRGLTLVVPGVAGVDFNIHSIVEGLAGGPPPDQVSHAVEVFDWIVPVPLLGPWINISAYERNRQQAGLLAQRVAAYRREYPGRPLNLVGHSAGVAIIVFALEALPPEVDVDHVVFLVGALSRDYDLSAAVQRVRGRLVNFSSTLDVVVGIGTTMFGTVDRKLAPSCGALGFAQLDEAPAPARQALARVVEVPWSGAMLAQANMGGHLDYAGRGWVSAWVVPILRDGQLPAGGADAPAADPSPPTAKPVAEVQAKPQAAEQPPTQTPPSLLVTQPSGGAAPPRRSSGRLFEPASLP